MVGVEKWAEIRRMRFVEGRSIRQIHRLTGYHRDTIRAALEGAEPPRYERPPRASKLDPFKDEIHTRLDDECEIPSQCLRELCEGLGYAGGKTIFDDYVREVRPRFQPWVVHFSTGLDTTYALEAEAASGPTALRHSRQHFVRVGLPCRESERERESRRLVA